MQGPWIVAQLPTASGNTVLQPSWIFEGPQTASRSAETVPVAELPWTLALDLRIHCGPPNIDFTLTLRLVLVWIRICVSMMVIVFVFSVWIRRLRPIFRLSQAELCLAVRERWLTAANFDRRSHCSGTMPNFYFREARQLWTLYRHSLPCDFFWKRRKHQQTDKTQKFFWHSTVDQSVHIALPGVFGRSAASGRSGWRRDFLSNRKYRYRPYTQPDVGNCWPWDKKRISVLPTVVRHQKIAHGLDCWMSTHQPHI